MHLVHPQKFVFNFSWDECNTQEKFRGNNGHGFFFFFFLGGGWRQWVLWSMWKW